MENKNICGIYLITSPTNKIYIGQSINILNRWKYHKYSFKLNTKISNSFKKYGFENHKFEIICECDETELNELEIFYIKKYNSFNSKIGLNLKSGGEQGGKLSEETKQKLSDSLKGREVWNVGIPVSKETKDKIRNSLINRKITDIHSIDEAEKIRKKISENTKIGINKSDKSKRKPINQFGDKNAQYGKIWVYNSELKLSKTIFKDELDIYLKNNWSLGRKMKF